MDDELFSQHLESNFLLPLKQLYLSRDHKSSIATLLQISTIIIHNSLFKCQANMLECAVYIVTH